MMPITNDNTVICIVKAIAQSRLQGTTVDADSTPAPSERELRAALIAAFGDSRQAACSDGDLARAALDLLARDPGYAEPIKIMTNQTGAAGVPQRYLDPASIALTTAALLVLQTRIKFKIDNTGKWSIELDKKSASDSAVKLLVQRLLSLLGK